MKKILSAIRSGFGFFSRIPVGLSIEGLNELVERNYFFVLIASVIGIIIGSFGIASIQIFPPFLSAGLIIFFIYFIIGFNHLDGLMDFGDGWMVHGSIEKKINAMKDAFVGAGGVGFCTIYLIILYAAIVEIVKFSENAYFIFLVLFVSEIGAKQSLLTIIQFGTPIHKGFGYMMTCGATNINYIIGLFISIILCFFALGIMGIIALFTSIGFSFIMLNIFNRNFGGINGDCIGASNEIGRLIMLITIIALKNIGM
ncbi:MAG: adenosylcobinamide-GDP ribazoletransferase [Methanosarcinaceae archaeon]|jgi:adenosylcobinamide-GDP ribazoletransferase|nr:adenosylcobinamide-GDP ribazoletransferase [Methanosarcinaceae archaeon]NKQ38671.1 adenosylcobinamide-GDP ribazoletransferase [Methanosarcinales archaeon]